MNAKLGFCVQISTLWKFPKHLNILIIFHLKPLKTLKLNFWMINNREIKKLFFCLHNKVGLHDWKRQFKEKNNKVKNVYT